MYHDLSVRQESLFALLQGNGRWLTPREIARMVRNWSAWRCPNRSRLKSASLHAIIRRELNALHSQGMTEQNRKITRLGALEIRHRIAQKTPKKPIENANGKVAPPENAKSADKMPCENANEKCRSTGEIVSLHPLRDATTKKTEIVSRP